MATRMGCANRWVLRLRFLTDLLTFQSLAIIGLQGFFPLKGQAAVGVGSIEYPVSERKRLAAL